MHCAAAAIMKVSAVPFPIVRACSLTVQFASCPPNFGPRCRAATAPFLKNAICLGRTSFKFSCASPLLSSTICSSLGSSLGEIVIAI
uniref:Putative secreted protein n=1 Tax=Anopheles darlingi TaxID=43151 RepID=A0A2M4DAP0_ANODA